MPTGRVLEGRIICKSERPGTVGGHPLELPSHPVARAIANAPLDDEPETDEERQSAAAASVWLEHNKPIPFEAVLRDFGFTFEDVKNFNEPPPPTPPPPARQ